MSPKRQLIQRQRLPPKAEKPRPKNFLQREVLMVSRGKRLPLNPERKAIHNLKYFTWVEQQGRTVEELDALWSASFWTDMQARIPEWDEAIDRFNEDTGALSDLRARADIA